MKYYLNTLLSFILFNSYGQTNECKTIGDKQNGLYVEYYPNCKKKIECYFKNGIYDSVYTNWDESGKYQVSGIYKNGKKEGLWRHDGRVLNGRRASNYVFTEYFYAEGNLKNAYEYVSTSDSISPKNGETFITYGKDTIEKDLVFYDNGQLAGESYKINGNIDSIEKIWDKKGRLIKEGFIKKAYPLKEIEYYFSYKSILIYINGFKSSLKQYDNSEKLFYEEYYNSKGKVIKSIGNKQETEYYKNYYSITYYENKVKKSYIEYDNASKQLYEEFYDKRGKVIKFTGVKQ
jgi:antitoxin component YwqK of YwqJK toxin-antitoxin module